MSKMPGGSQKLYLSFAERGKVAGEPHGTRNSRAIYIAICRGIIEQYVEQYVEQY